MGRSASTEMKKRRSKKKDNDEKRDDKEETDEEEESEGEEETEEQEKNEPVLVELGDPQAIKTALDDSIVQMVWERGFPEDQAISNAKIGLGLLASSFGLFGQFHEYIGFPKFPDDRHILGFCVAGYMVCSAILSILAVLWEKNYIAAFKGKVDRENVYPPLSKGENIPKWCQKIVAIKVETQLQKYETDFTVIYEIQNEDGVWQEPQSATHSITKWFNINGEFIEESFQKWARDALKNAAECSK